MTTHLHLSTGGGELRLEPQHLIVAGYTGSDQAAIRHHIEELAAIGVPEPETVPAFYDLDTALATTVKVIAVDTTTTSGEVEPVLILDDGHYYLTVGSDHTDRELEKEGIKLSKAACPKPIAGTVIDLGTDPSALDWDKVEARSWVDGDLYQEGHLSALLPAGVVLEKWRATGADSSSLLLFGGTLPLLDGTFRYGQHWRMELVAPGHQPIELRYSTKVRNS